MLTIGIDSGSSATKGVVLGGNAILACAERPTSSDSRKTATEVLHLVLSQSGIRMDDVDFIVGTGYGRVNLPFAHKVMTEITCHAAGAWHQFPGTSLVIDVGGQDSKVISIGEDGLVEDFLMNDKCAAGTGRFLEVMSRVLEIPIGQIGEVALRSGKAVPISSTCTVFAESEVVSLIGKGCPKQEIAKGLHQAIVDRLEAMVRRLNPRGQITFTGGVARNPGIVAMLAERLRKPINIPEHPSPEMMGALGAALMARRNLI